MRPLRNQIKAGLVVDLHVELIIFAQKSFRGILVLIQKVCFEGGFVGILFPDTFSAASVPFLHFSAYSFELL